MFSMFFSKKKKCRLWDNVENCDRVGQATDDNTIGHMRPAFWLTKATDTSSKYVILIALPQQHWLRELDLLLRYT
jgi:hypothetical protein